MTGSAPDPDVVAEWHARSEGNPFFLIELARLGADPAQAGAVPGDRPRRGRAAVRGAARADPVAAAAGRGPRSAVLARRARRRRRGARGRGRRPARRRPARPGWCSSPEAGTVAFTHALTRDAVAATTTASRLARLHARVAHALADGGAVAAPGRTRGAGGRAGPALAGRRSVVRRTRLAGRRRRRRAGPPHLLVGGGRAAGGRRHRGPPARPARHRRRSGSTCCSPGPATADPTRSGTRCCPCAAEAIALARREEDLPRLVAAAAAATRQPGLDVAAVERGARGHRRRPALGAGPAPRSTTRRTGAG